jgi:hypothetical protein
MSALNIEALLRVTGGKLGIHDIACPLCGPDRRAPANRARRVLRVWYVSPDFITYSCARCGETGYVRDRNAPRATWITRARVQSEMAEHARAAAADRLRIALALWRLRQPPRGTIAETYLREARGYGGPLPPTLGFLPARGEYPPAIVAAFGMPDEPEPGVLALHDANIKGVHLTKLQRNGCDRERGEKAKIMIGMSCGAPIVLAPPNDLLGLVITEGIEDGLSAHLATDLGSWVAGSASRLPSISDAIPDCIEAITVLVDADEVGRRHAKELTKRLNARSIDCRLILPGSSFSRTTI